MSNTLTIQITAKVLIDPVVDAGPDVTVDPPEDSVVLTMIASDADGVIISHLWTFTGLTADGMVIESPNAASTVISNMQENTAYTFQAQVMDDDGNTATDTVTVTVNAASLIPPHPIISGGGVINIGQIVANRVELEADVVVESIADQFTFVITAVSSDLLIYGLDATYFDTYDSTLTKVWLQDNNTLDPPKIGTIIGWDTGTNKLILTFAGGWDPSLAAGTTFKMWGKRSGVTLDGSASFDPDGSIASYLWSFPVGSGLVTLDTPTAAVCKVLNLHQTGIIAIQLQVTDNDALVSTQGTTITVTSSETSVDEPTVEAGVSGAGTVTTLLGTSVGLTGTAVPAIGVVSTEYFWTLSASPSGATVFPTIVNGNTLTPTIEFPAGATDGDYVFDLIVLTDGVSASDSTTITISSTGVYLETVSEVVSGDDMLYNLAVRGGEAGELVDLQFNLAQEGGVAKSSADVLNGHASVETLETPGISTTTIQVTLDGSGEFTFQNEVFGIVPPSGDTYSVHLSTSIAVAASSAIIDPYVLTTEHSITTP
tara:strand:- start:70604 stop:72226 length:1623 start_codon:yes stop_codon:yes gene_type:complete